MFRWVCAARVIILCLAILLPPRLHALGTEMAHAASHEMMTHGCDPVEGPPAQPQDPHFPASHCIIACACLPAGTIVLGDVAAPYEIDALWPASASLRTYPAPALVLRPPILLS